MFFMTPTKGAWGYYVDKRYLSGGGSVCSTLPTRQ